MELAQRLFGERFPTPDRAEVSLHASCRLDFCNAT